MDQAHPHLSKAIESTLSRNGPTLQIATRAGSNLKFFGMATCAAAITLNKASQTMEATVGGGLTINAAQNATNGTIKVFGGMLSTVNDVTLCQPGGLTGFGTDVERGEVMARARNCAGRQATRVASAG